MSELIITSNEVKDTLLLTLEGSIDESFLNKTVRIPAGKTVIIDFNKITNINSLGVRHWIQWVRTYPSSRFVLRHCPQCIVDQMNAVSDFIPARTTVESFYAPYYSENTGEEKKILYKNNVDYNISKAPEVKNITDSQGEKMEMDVHPNKYFKFLTPKKTKNVS